MSYQNPHGDAVDYQTLDDLVIDLIAHPNKLFIRDHGKDALVYVPEFDQILWLSVEGTLGSAEVCKAALQDKLKRIKELPS